jgi:hypothetical protein
VTPPAPAVKAAAVSTPTVPEVKKGGLTFTKKPVTDAVIPASPPVLEKRVAYSDPKSLPTIHRDKRAEPAPGVDIIAPGTKVKFTATWCTEYQPWRTHDTGVVVASYTHGRPQFRPGLDLYKIVLDKTRIPGKEEVLVNYHDIARA